MSRVDEVSIVLRSKIAAAAFLVATFGVAFSQDNATQHTTAEDAGVGKPVSTTAELNPCAPSPEQTEQAEIRSDTQGVDFGPYMRKLVKTARESWYSLMPPSVYPPASKQGRVSVEFLVHKDGRIDEEKVEVSSGDEVLDRAAFGSISTLKVDPLPKNFSGDELKLCFHFYYNLSPDHARVYISPCRNVRVPVNSTMQFSVPIGGIEHVAVTWSLSGKGCEGGACGTISENGVYTAPAKVPDPPRVFVTATPVSKKSFPVKAELTVVASSEAH